MTNNIIKSVSQLDQRKHRKRDMAFKAEGTKCVLDTIPYFTLEALYATSEWIEAHKEFADCPQLTEATRGDIRRMSSLTTPADVIAVYEIPERALDIDACRCQLILALDTIQDPGNLGTIIRVADWYGITNIICTKETSDCFSPKVIQSTMGSISRVAVHYCDLRETILEIGTTVYGTFLDGEDIDKADLSQTGIIVIGNEGNGISPTISEIVDKRLTIPSYPVGRPTGESLNAAIATAITISKFRSSK